jgi:hypothetical protein
VYFLSKKYLFNLPGVEIEKYLEKVQGISSSRP